MMNIELEKAIVRKELEGLAIIKGMEGLSDDALKQKLDAVERDYDAAKAAGRGADMQRHVFRINAVKKALASRGLVAKRVTMTLKGGKVVQTTRMVRQEGSQLPLSEKKQ
jgi:crotonobetainyl-CoA:carnitine CoA-transferase CaiB-like acyl-CoA transferase